MKMERGLPVGVAAFVGREHERGKVADLVVGARVVTLIGPGGCGKTRLALEVAGDVASRFSEGVHWVDLQGLRAPHMVAAAVAAAAGVHERPHQPLIETLAEQLRARHLLAVLDNCEHLVTACAELVAALSSACPHLHVLATSRVPLAVDGEATFGVGPLSVPGPDARSASTVAAAEAVRLFEVRARQVASEFRIGEDNAVAVAEICRRLDGIPLAIELAAARVRVLAPAQIAAGLSDRFRLLTGGLRGAPARQQTLEASLDWSYGLLDDTQRLGWARLSVFAGSFQLDAAEAVVSGDGIDRDDVLDLIAALAEQSMLEVVERDGRARYRLLETIRVYAGRRLSELDDPAGVRDRHLAFHVALAGRAHSGLSGGQPEASVTRLAADLDDLRAAMDWAGESGDLRALLGITEPIVRFWFERGLSGEVRRRLHDAVDDPSAPHEQRVRGLTTAALLSLGHAGDPVSAYRSASQAVDAADAADVGGALALALAVRAQAGAASGLSTSEQVYADVKEAVEHAQRSGDAATRAYVLALSGWTLLRSHTIDAGCRLLEQAIDVSETAGVAYHLPAAYGMLGLWPVWTGRLDQSRGHARRAVELARQVGRPAWEAIGLAGIGAADALEGNHGQAQDWLSRAEGALRARGLEGSHYEMWLSPWIALSAHASGDLTTARSTAEAIVRISRASGSRWDEAVGEWLMGVLAHARERSDDARAHLEASYALSTDPRLPFPLGRSLLGLAELASQDEDFGNAGELACEGLEVLDDYGDRVGVAAALEAIAVVAGGLGQPERSLRLLAASQRFHTDTRIARLTVQSDRFDRARDAARAALDPNDATACWNAGGELSLADAVAYARRGRGKRQRPHIGWESLTPAERDVVRLVAEGHTNAEIGERLFISVNTVKKHLTHVYGKLNADGRADLAAQVARRDLYYHPRPPKYHPPG